MILSGSRRAEDANNPQNPPDCFLGQPKSRKVGDVLLKCFLKHIFSISHGAFVCCSLKTLFAHTLLVQVLVVCNTNSGAEQNEKIELIRQQAMKMLHKEIFGIIERHIHELNIHIHNQDFESCLDIIDLINNEIRGD